MFNARFGHELQSLLRKLQRTFEIGAAFSEKRRGVHLFGKTHIWEAIGIVTWESFGTSDYGTFFGIQFGGALGNDIFGDLFGMCIPKVFGN